MIPVNQIIDTWMYKRYFKKEERRNIISNNMMIRTKTCTIITIHITREKYLLGKEKSFHRFLLLNLS